MKTSKMTIRLSDEELAFAKRYARKHGLTLTGLIHRYLDRLSQGEEGGIPKEVDSVAGIVPLAAEAKEEYRAHVIRKHS
jgi:hypothetical protein